MYWNFITILKVFALDKVCQLIILKNIKHLKLNNKANICQALQKNNESHHKNVTEQFYFSLVNLKLKKIINNQQPNVFEHCFGTLQIQKENCSTQSWKYFLNHCWVEIVFIFPFRFNCLKWSIFSSKEFSLCFFFISISVKKKGFFLAIARIKLCINILSFLFSLVWFCLLSMNNVYNSVFYCILWYTVKRIDELLEECICLWNFNYINLRPY